LGRARGAKSILEINQGKRKRKAKSTRGDESKKNKKADRG
jgi:hypothetical protein